MLVPFLEWRTLVHERAAGLAEAGALASPERIRAFHESFVLVAVIFLLAAIPAWLMRTERSRR